MSTPPVTVRFWASARAAAGVASEELPVEGPTTLADVVRRLLEAHAGRDFERVVGVCSVLVGERQTKGHDPEQVVVQPGESVEFLPPFAGG